MSHVHPHPLNKTALQAKTSMEKDQQEKDHIKGPANSLLAMLPLFLET